jgi:hypothetical protein
MQPREPPGAMGPAPVEPAAPATPAAAPPPPGAHAALVLFARLPVPGAAKTRLAAAAGPEAAAEFYRACAEHAFRQALRCVPAGGAASKALAPCGHSSCRAGSTASPFPAR